MPLRAHSVYETDSQKTLPNRQSFVSLEGPGIVTTAFKPAEDGEGFVLRAYETLGESSTAVLSSCTEITSLEEVNLIEQAVDRPNHQEIPFAAFEIKTLRFHLGAQG